MSVYRENVLEIVDNWEGYPLQDPACEADLSDLSPAINAGIVEVKCFINNICPFHKSAYKEDGLVFNKDTYARIQPWLPNDLDYALSVTGGTNGMHFTPRWVYRHNYIYQKSPYAVTTGPSSIFPDLFTNFDTNYVEVSQIRDGSGSGIEGVDMTRYKPEQSWVVAKSIFDTIVTVTDSVECDHQAEWSYVRQKAAGNGIEDSDLKYDYFKDYYEEYDNSWEVVDGKWKIKPADPATGQSGQLLINKARTQMPVQTRVLSTENTGVHWRLRKRTPLYNGEDFFIRFYKQADDTISNPHDKAPVPFPEEFKHYWPLDITHNEKVTLAPGGTGIPALMRKMNFGVSPPLVENERPTNDFDFHDQAYYIIELGEKSDTDNYFIIITERANPIFVHLVAATSNAPGGGSVFVSKRLGEPASIPGKQLIHAKWFDMTVRMLILFQTSYI